MQGKTEGVAGLLSEAEESHSAGALMARGRAKTRSARRTDEDVLTEKYVEEDRRSRARLQPAEAKMVCGVTLLRKGAGPGKGRRT